MFNNKHFSVEILNVKKAKWSAKEKDVQYRFYHTLSFRLKGSSYYKEGEDYIESKTNSIMHIPKDCNFHFYCKDDNEIINVWFNVSGHDFPHFEVFNPSVYERYLTQFEKLLDVWSKKDDGYLFIADSIFYKILGMIEKESKGLESTIIENFNQGIAYLRENFSDPQLTVKAIAAQAHMSETYFRKLFKENYSTTPNKYITKLRLENALPLLSSSFFSINDVAEMCGFSSPKYFANQFKKEYKCQPSSLRK